LNRKMHPSWHRKTLNILATIGFSNSVHRIFHAVGFCSTFQHDFSSKHTYFNNLLIIHKNVLLSNRKSPTKSVHLHIVQKHACEKISEWQKTYDENSYIYLNQH